MGSSHGANIQHSRDPAPVRRIDWQHCTILPASAVSGRSASPDDIKAPENVLEALKALFERVAFDEAIPMYIADLDGRIIHVNEGYLRFVSGGGDGAVQPTPNNDRLPPGLRAVIEEVRLTGQTVTLEEKVRAGDHIRYYRSRHFPITDNDGHVVAVGGTYVDCTAQVEGLAAANAAHRRFRDFARASSDWFWETDHNGRLIMVSDQLTAVLGKPAVSLRGCALAEIGTFQGEEGG
ncbi:MAG: PAS domain-containing protein, partial [Alphaproteobacteria bacterium]